MSPEETRFLKYMDFVCDHQALYASKPSAAAAMHCVRSIKAFLKLAGQELGLYPRFDVWADEEKIHIQPKNGIASRMMDRYKELFMDRELS